MNPIREIWPIYDSDGKDNGNFEVLEFHDEVKEPISLLISDIKNCQKNYPDAIIMPFRILWSEKLPHSKRKAIKNGYSTT